MPDLDDKTMISTPNNWPIWPVLPMKREVEGKMWPETGFFLNPSLSDDVVFFYTGSIYDMKEATKTDLTPEQVLEQGWVVD